MPVPATTPNLKPGVYTPLRTPFGWALRKIEAKHDRIIKLGIADEAFTTIKKFWSMKDKYRELGLLHKRGFLFYGPPGTGKSMALVLICEAIAEVGGMAFLATDPDVAAIILRMVRDVHPEMPIACAWEDIEQWVDGEEPDDRSTMTSLLDGEIQIDNVVHLATTNHLDQIDEAFANRPGRFDDVVFVGSPDYGVRMDYLQNLVPKGDPELIKELANKSAGLLLSHLRDIVVSVFALDHPVDDTIARLKKMADVSKHMEEEKKAKAIQPALKLKMPRGVFGR